MACRFPIDEIENSSALQSLWENYRTSFDHAADIQWETIIRAFRQMYDMERDLSRVFSTSNYSFV